MKEKNILCIDLKSFFASVECVERGLDPFTTPLVVTDIKRGSGAITLAVTPYLKKLGVKSRGRVFELPKNIKIIYAKPRMNLYLRKSTEVIDVYMDYVSDEDIHIYSVDEVFLDVTNYLKYYNMTDYELALNIMESITERTGLTSTCGIGPNMLLAKIALDTESKHNKDFIAKWTYDDVKKKLWEITPLSDMWGIGSRMEKRLNSLGIKKIGDIMKYSLNFYKKRFGVIGEEIYYHANGIDLSNIENEKKESKEKSFGTSQILFRDYKPEEVPLIIKEMLEVLSVRLRKSNKVCTVIYLAIGYSKEYGGGFSHSKKLLKETDDEETIYELLEYIFYNYVEELPIRKVSISLCGLEDKNSVQLNLFENIFEQLNKNNYSNTIDEIHNKYGKNSILKASSLLDSSTIKRRNKIVGGHHE